jgi:N-dimethylarginine dimethylaminohydrolase
MQRILMVSPEYFDITYAINPHMKDSSGKLNQIDKPKAVKQWKALKSLYEKLGFEVCVIPGQPGLPDMVFAANQAIFFNDKILLSHMRSEYRRPEIEHFRKWFTEKGYTVFDLEAADLCLEGNGDTQFHSATNRVYGAYGPRTDRAVYEELFRRFDLEVVDLELVKEEFYHLDTCFSILGETTVAICPDAFSKEGLASIKACFKNVINVSAEESKNFFACNCHCPNGKDVILQKGAIQFVEALNKHGFAVHEVETSEFIKAGGSVFCLKMQLY